MDSDRQLLKRIYDVLKYEPISSKFTPVWDELAALFQGSEPGQLTGGVVPLGASLLIGDDGPEVFVNNAGETLDPKTLIIKPKRGGKG